MISTRPLALAAVLAAACLPNTQTPVTTTAGELSETPPWGDDPPTAPGDLPDTPADPGTTEPDSSFTPIAGNPFDGSEWYRNPLYAEQVLASRALAPNAARGPLDVVADTPTAVWLDRVASIQGTDGGMGVRDHLDEALAQQAELDDPSTPMLVPFVVYDLPDRDCSAAASNGELHLDEAGLLVYQHQFIEPLALAFSDPAYADLRIVVILEPDALANLVTNLNGMFPACATAAPGYEAGLTYAIPTLAAVDNVSIYLDMAHSGWLGWEHTANAAVVYSDLLEAAGGAHLVRGFATNVANYTSVQEAFDPYVDINANTGVIESFYQWNRMIDEQTFVDEMRTWFPRHGFLVDTSRSGWDPTGGTAPADQRTHRGNWCNIAGAGIGDRPRANPASGVDAWYWIKPPGESDGTSDPSATTPNAEGKRHDPMCGTEDVVRPHGNVLVPTDALDDAPHAGEWFHEQLLMLVQNATPPL